MFIDVQTADFFDARFARDTGSCCMIRITAVYFIF